MPAKSYAQVLDLEAQKFEPLQMLGEAAYLWMHMGEDAPSREVFEALTVLAPDDPVGHLGLAELGLNAREYRAAEGHAKQAARVGNRSPSALALAYCLQGEALLGQEKRREAEQAWETAHRADPAGPGGQSAKERLEAARAAGLFSATAAG